MAEKTLNPNVEENDEILTLIADDGTEADFVEIANVELKGKTYTILQPVELLEGMEDDEALVFEVTTTAGSDDARVSIVIDDSIIDEVFNEYYKLLDQEEA